MQAATLLARIPIRAARPPGFHRDIGAAERQTVEDDSFNNGFGFF